MLNILFLALYQILSCQYSFATLAPLVTDKRRIIPLSSSSPVDGHNQPMTFSWMIIARKQSSNSQHLGIDMLANTNNHSMIFEGNDTMTLIGKQSKSEVIKIGNGQVDSMQNWNFNDTKISLERIIESIIIQRFECEIWIYADCCYAGNMARNLAKLKSTNKDISIYAAHKPQSPASPILNAHHRGEAKSIMISGKNQNIDFSELMKVWSSSQNNNNNNYNNYRQYIISGHRLQIFDP